MSRKQPINVVVDCIICGLDVARAPQRSGLFDLVGYRRG